MKSISFVIGIMIGSLVMIKVQAASVQLPSAPTPPEHEAYQEGADEQEDIPEAAPSGGEGEQEGTSAENISAQAQEQEGRQIIPPRTGGDRIRPAQSLESLSMDEAIAYLEPLIRAESEDQIVVSMKNLSLEKARKILDYIADSSLPTDLKIQIILGVSLYYANNKADQESLFSMIDYHSELSQEVPLIFSVARGSYPQLIADLLERKQDQKSQMIDDALMYAIKEGRLDLFKIINEYAKEFDAEKATQFLWRAIEQKSPLEFIHYFVEKGADVEYEQDGRNIFILAVEHLNKPVVELIVHAVQNNPKRNLNKLVNRFIDVHVGTPLQIARAIQRDPQRSEQDKKIAAEIEVFLRVHGATENKN